MKQITFFEGVVRVLFDADETASLKPVVFSVSGKEFLRQTAYEFSPRPVYRLNGSAHDIEVWNTANGETLNQTLLPATSLRARLSAFLKPVTFYHAKWSGTLTAPLFYGVK